jgi:tripartite-type tricarboxylate transporter receptor subunit TctC
VLARPAFAQYPDKAVTIYCAFTAGAAADASLRALAQAAGKHLGQQVVVDNRPGVAGTLAASTLMNARPDGYTLAQVTNTLVRQPFIARTNYDIAKDFSYVMGVTAFEFGLAVRADAPWKTLNDFLVHAKANPGLTYGTSGIGTAQHQVMEQLAEARGIRWTHVPYKGTAPLLNDLQGGHLHAISDTTGWAPFVDSGKFRALAVYNAGPPCRRSGRAASTSPRPCRGASSGPPACRPTPCASCTMPSARPWTTRSSSPPWPCSARRSAT